MTDTKCEFCGCSTLSVSGEGAETFTYSPDHQAKNMSGPEHEDVVIVEVEFITKIDAI